MCTEHKYINVYTVVSCIGKKQAYMLFLLLLIIIHIFTH